jgi:hypothetical protein
MIGSTNGTDFKLGHKWHSSIVSCSCGAGFDCVKKTRIQSINLHSHIEYLANLFD